MEAVKQPREQINVRSIKTGLDKYLSQINIYLNNFKYTTAGKTRQIIVSNKPVATSTSNNKSCKLVAKNIEKTRNKNTIIALTFVSTDVCTSESFLCL